MALFELNLFDNTLGDLRLEMNESVIKLLYKNRAEAEALLNNIHKEINQPYSSNDHHKFTLLKVQAAIIQFELCSGFLNLIMTPENCFASKVIFKGLIHIIFEYKKALKRHHLKTIMDLCESKSFYSERENLKRIDGEYRKAIKDINKYMELRNKATGHYDPDIEKQVSYIGSINEEEALKIIKQFVLFNNNILESLSRIGRKT